MQYFESGLKHSYARNLKCYRYRCDATGSGGFWYSYRAGRTEMQNVRKVTISGSIRLENEDVRLLSHCANEMKDMKGKKC